MKSKNSKKWRMPVAAILMGVVGIMGLSSFVGAGESGLSAKIYLQPDNNHWVSGAEQVVKTESNSYTVSASGTITIEGIPITVGGSVGSTVEVSYTLVQCKKCFWGTWGCDRCNPKDDYIQYIIP